MSIFKKQKDFSFLELYNNSSEDEFKDRLLLHYQTKIKELEDEILKLKIKNIDIREKYSNQLNENILLMEKIKDENKND